MFCHLVPIRSLFKWRSIWINLRFMTVIVTCISYRFSILSTTSIHESILIPQRSHQFESPSMESGKLEKHVYDEGFESDL